MITDGFGTQIDIATGTVRQRYMSRERVKRWVNNDEPVAERAASECSTDRKRHR